jgi:hypothetical protein
MWWDIAPDLKAEFEDWHSHEHFPERMAIPGFLRATRWTSAAGGDGIFVMYEVEKHETLASPQYVARLNAPSPWSTKMMPHHRNIVRSQCYVLVSHGGAVTRHALTLRFSSQTDRDADARGYFNSLGQVIVSQPGLVGMHLLKHRTPAIPQTAEQKLRNAADKTADYVFVVAGYDLAALQDLSESSLTTDSLMTVGIAPGAVLGLYSLSHSATRIDSALGSSA